MVDKTIAKQELQDQHPELSEILDKLGAILRIDVRERLIDHLPKPKAVEQKEATEAEMWKKVREARAAHEDSEKKKKKAEDRLAKAKEAHDEAAKAAKAAAELEATACEHKDQVLSEFFYAYPAGKGRHDLFKGACGAETRPRDTDQAEQPKPKLRRSTPSTRPSWRKEQRWTWEVQFQKQRDIKGTSLLKDLRQRRQQLQPHS